MPATSVEMAVLADPAITERQKRVLIDVYASFVKENEKSAEPDDHRPDHSPHHQHPQEKAMPRKETPDQAKKAAVESDYAPLYAVAGLTDALADALAARWPRPRNGGRKRLTELQSRGPARTAAGQAQRGRGADVRHHPARAVQAPARGD